MRHLLRLASLLLVPALAAGCGGDDGPASTSNPILVMKIEGVGAIEIEFYPEVAPKTVKNFIDLAEGKREWKDPTSGKMVKKPFFDGLTFHRVIKDFMLQGGDPLGTGMGGPGYAFEDEINAKSLGLHEEKLFPGGDTTKPHPHIASLLGPNPQQAQVAFQRMVTLPLLERLGIPVADASKRVKEWQPKLIQLTLEDVYANQGYVYDSSLASLPMKKGYVAMANSGPNTNGSQFFINLADNVYLNGKHTVFGKVIAGMDVVEKIGAMKTDPRSSRPLAPVVIESVRLR